MIELEVYAAGLRNIDKILELDHQLETIPGLRYKVDRSHDLVYLEMEEAGITLRELRAMFRKIGLEPRFWARLSCSPPTPFVPLLLTDYAGVCFSSKLSRSGCYHKWS